MNSVDVAIVGAGVVGSATAYHLLKHGFSGSILLIEKDTTYAYGCTARAVGGMRQQFSCPENILLSRYGLDFIRTLKRDFGAEADVGFREQGYLLLATASGMPQLMANVEIQRALGADVGIMEEDALRGEFPWLFTDGLAGASFSRSGEGWIDPSTLMAVLRKKALEGGATLIRDEVIAVERSGDRIASLSLRSGRSLAVGALVNAAGAWAGALAGMAGVDLPVGPRKRYVYVLDCPRAGEDLHRAPLTVDPTGVYLRPEGRHFLTGLSPPLSEEPRDMDWEVDYAWFEERIWPLLAERVPVFEAIKVINAWVGQYDYNVHDENGIIGRHPRIANFYFGNGFSGHGLQQGPATGNAIAELIVYGEYRTIDLSRLGYERILRGETYGETNII
ncbi:MAG TPA: FAD-dependent oxidoreductase [Aestuariivirgaceae bacterium]|nr:FAD-dependent oxidoreductase [Aestuariivirgaceae bacterium]